MKLGYNVDIDIFKVEVHNLLRTFKKFNSLGSTHQICKFPSLHKSGQQLLKTRLYIPLFSIMSKSIK